MTFSTALPAPLPSHQAQDQLRKKLADARALLEAPGLRPPGFDADAAAALQTEARAGREGTTECWKVSSRPCVVSPRIF